MEPARKGRSRAVKKRHALWAGRIERQIDKLMHDDLSSDEELPAERLLEGALENRTRVLAHLADTEVGERLAVETDVELVADELLDFAAEQQRAVPEQPGGTAEFVDGFVQRPVPRKRASVSDIFGAQRGQGLVEAMQSPLRNAAERAKRGDVTPPRQARKSVTEKEVQEALAKFFKKGKSATPQSSASSERRGR